MPVIDLECPNCHESLELDAGFAGGVCRCANCGTLMTVPENAGEKAEIETLGVGKADGSVARGPTPDNFDDLLTIGEYLGFLHEADSAFELRSPDAGDKVGASDRYTISGFFNDIDFACQAAARLDAQKRTSGIYCTINPIRPELLDEKTKNRLNDRADDVAQDRDIAMRRWFPIQIEARRPSGFMSTDTEIQHCYEAQEQIYDDLQDEDWPEPIVCATGNGVQMLYRVDLPTNDGGLIEAALAKLAERYSNDEVLVREDAHHAAALTEMIGTWLREGRNLINVEGAEDRPYRISELVRSPMGEISIVDRAQLEVLAGMAPGSSTAAAPAPSSPTRAAPSMPTIDLDDESDDASPRRRRRGKPQFATAARVPGQAAPLPQVAEAPAPQLQGAPQVQTSPSATTTPAAPAVSAPASNNAPVGASPAVQWNAPTAGKNVATSISEAIDPPILSHKLSGTLDRLIETHLDHTVGMPTGSLPKLDEYTLGIRGLSVLASNPGVGKTSFGAQIGLSIVQKNPGACFVFFSFEMDIEDVQRRFLSTGTGVHWRDLVLGAPKNAKISRTDDGLRLTEVQRTRFVEGLDMLRGLADRISIIDCTRLSHVTAEWMRDAVESFKRKTGTSRAFVLMDSLESMPLNPNITSQADAVNRAMADLLSMQRSSGDAIMVTASQTTLDEPASSRSMGAPDFVIAMREVDVPDERRQIDLEFVKGRDGITRGTIRLFCLDSTYLYVEGRPVEKEDSDQ